MQQIRNSPFYFVRHGQTDWNLQKRAMGQQNIPLNPNGIKQALELKNAFKNQVIKTICYSPLERAKMTAEIINESINCQMVCIHDLKEFYLGKFEGQVKDSWFDEWKAGKSDTSFESYSEFITRALRGINTALTFSPNVLIVAHGGVYWAIQHAINIFDDHDLPNCTPILHIPPKDGQTVWKRKIIQVDIQLD